MIDYGEKHDRIVQTRKDLMTLKSALKKLCPPHEAMLRHKVTFQKKGNPNNKKHVATLNKKL